MKKIILYILSKFLNDDIFRYKVCEEIHKYHQNYFSEQTIPGRFYDACEEFFLASEVVQRNVNRLEKDYLEMLYRGVTNVFRKRILLEEVKISKFSKSLFHRPKINKIIKFK